jgi:hypothetical protein
MMNEKKFIKSRMIGPICLGLFFMLALFGAVVGYNYLGSRAFADVATYSVAYTENFSTTIYKDAAKTTLTWDAGQKMLYLPWDYSKAKTSGVAYSTNINTQAGNVVSAKIIDSSNFENQSSYANITYALSNDGGNIWVNASSNQLVTFSTTGKDLRWKINITNTNLNSPSSPAVSNLAVYYNVAATVSTTTSLVASVVPNNITTLEKGATNVQLIAIKLTNTGTEDVILSGIVIPGVYSPINEVNTNLYVGDTKIGAPTILHDSAITYSGLSIKIAKGSSVTLIVKGDIATTNIRTTMVYPIDSNTSITAKGISGNTANITVTAGNSTLTVKEAASPVYVLTVNNGTGTGSYAQGKTVAISANPTISEKVFNRWTGDTDYVSSVTSASAVVTMPAKAISLVATYKDSPATSYDLSGNFTKTDFEYDANSNKIFGTVAKDGQTYYGKLDGTSDNTFATTGETCDGRTGYAKGWVMERKYVSANKYQVQIMGHSKSDCGLGSPESSGWIKLNSQSGWKITDTIKCEINHSRGNVIDTYCTVNKDTGEIKWRAGSDCYGCCACGDGAGVDIKVTVEKGSSNITPASPATTSNSTCSDQHVIKDGGMIRLHGGIDVYIIKYKNCKQFKRLILSPSVFKSYGHLKWSDIVNVDGATFDTFATSDYVSVSGDNKVWKLEPDGDNGSKTRVSSGYDPDSVYEINGTDRDSYR